MPHAAQHLTAEQLAAFGLGKLAPGQAEAVARHLEDCDACRRLLEEVSPDSFVGLVKAAHEKPASAPAASRLDSAGPAGPAGRPGPVPDLPPELADHPKFRVLRLLGRGGMGTVYQARHTFLDRDVALKVINPALVDHPEAVERFRAEVKALARLSHPHFVQALDAEQAGNLHLLVMEFVDGVSLDRLLERSGPRPVDQACRLIAQAAAGLQHAHEQGMVHRDLKPQNLMVTKEGKVKVLDLGLTRLAGGRPGRGLTQADAFMGTPEYVAPEQAADARSADIRSDVYSLGCTLYCLLAGRPPFVEPTAVKAILAHIEKEPEPLPRLRPDVPEALWAVVARMLAKDPARRFQTPIEVARALALFCRPGARREAGGGPPPLPGVGSPGRGTAIGGDTSEIRAVLREVPGGTPAREAPAKDETANRPNTARPPRKAAKQSSSAWYRRRPVLVGMGTAVAVVVLGSGAWLLAPVLFKTKAETAGGEALTVAAPKKEPPTSPDGLPPARASNSLEALRRDRIPPEALAAAGDGDPNKSPATLVGVLGEAVPIHNQPVLSLAFSADSRWLASGSADQTVILRETTTCRVRRVLRGHTGAVSSVAFSKDGRTLVSASVDGTLKLWSTEKHAELKSLHPNLGAIWAMAASPDGRYLAAGGSKGAIKLWKWGQWGAPVSIPPITGKVTTLAFSPDGELLASGWDENKPEAPIRIFKTADGKLTQTLPGHPKRVVAVTFRPDGKALASVGDERFPKVWDLASGNSAEFGSHNNWARCVAFSADGQTLAVGVAWFLVLHGPLARTVRGLDSTFPKALAFSPDGNLFAVGADTGSVFVWDTTSGEQQWFERGHPHRIAALAVSPDGRTVLSGGDDFTVRRWDLNHPGENEILGRFGRGGRPFGSEGVNLVAYSPDGKTFAAAAARLIVWDAVNAREQFSDSVPLLSLVYSPDGKTLAGCGEDGSVRLWDVPLSREVYRFPPAGKCKGLAFSPDGQLLAAVSQDRRTVTIWSVVTGAEVRSWEDSSMFAAAFSPDGKLLATGHHDGTISLWNPADGQKKRTFRGHTAAVRSLRFSPDGQTLISTAEDGTVRLWNPEALRAREVIPVGPANRPLVMDLDPSGRYLIAAGHSPVIYLLRPTVSLSGASGKGRGPTGRVLSHPAR